MASYLLAGIMWILNYTVRQQFNRPVSPTVIIIAVDAGGRLIDTTRSTLPRGPGTLAK